MRIAVVGGGASGTLTCAQLVRQSAARGLMLDLHVVEALPLGQGVAYSTTDLRHRLNVPALGMSAWPDDRSHFQRWWHARRDLDLALAGTAYAPRPMYARYLDDVLVHELAVAPLATLTQHRTRATDLLATPDGVRVETAAHGALEVDAVVLATGNGTPSSDWAPKELRDSPRFVTDPWRPGALPELAPGSQVLAVGTGLTMVDVATTYGSCRVQAVSRHGMLPLPHARRPSAALAPVIPTGPLALRDLRRLLFEHIRAADGDWRAAVDSLRPLTGELWRSLDDATRRDFVHRAQRRWDRARHRMDPELADDLQRRRAPGCPARVDVRSATVTGAVDTSDGVRVSLSDGATVCADLVVNCTGPSAAVTSSGDPLLQALLRRDAVRPGPLGLGLATDGTGRIAGAERLLAWTLGPLRRGELWETTAVPEIRTQAEQVARAVLATLTASDAPSGEAEIRPVTQEVA